ncbi:C40 family peptidase [Blastococcus sp. LR1]|uniref:C40 family peptidase n=1 Tax=Blastococcus sp. LR1 TaxID=2877000 RepID=UPI001CCE863B|nr:C40 family peptidase [Blastococcus sp. LR1]MCA0143800.1 C40 family peptidase [Blastococcus sp. LR1]
MEGLAQVQSRIAEIQGQLSSFARPAATTSVAWADAALVTGLTPTNEVTPSNATPLPAGARTPAGTTADESAIVAKAQEYVGVPYLWGGTDPSKGLDCSGFTQLVYRSLGIELPRVSAQQATVGRAVPSLNEARPGDLLFFDYSPSRPGIDHAGIYIGDGKMIAAPQPGEVVKIQSAGQPTLIRRALPEAAD